MQVSVVLPYRNAESFIGEAIGSILGQTFQSFELLAVNDGSTDASVAIVRQVRDPRLRMLDSAGRGLPTALNRALAEARGRYIARMDADDVALPDRLERQVAILDRHPRLCVLGSAVERIDSAGRLLDVAWYPSTPAAIRTVLAGGQCCLCNPTTLMRRSTLIEAGGYPASWTEDFDLWLRVARVGDLANLDRPLLRYRLHAGSIAFIRTRDQLTALLRSALLNRDGLPPRERVAIESCDDVAALVEMTHPGRDTAEALTDAVSWYVENAVTAGLHREALDLVTNLAALAPAGSRARVEAWLHASAAVTALAHGRPEHAATHLAAIRLEGPALRVLTNAVAAPPALAAQAHGGEVPTLCRGYVDSVHLYMDRTRLLVFGWMPVEQDELPRAVRLIVPAHVPAMSLRLVRRFDVARAIGDDHLFAGFRIDASLEKPLPLGVTPAVWTRTGATAWNRLQDATVFVDAPVL